ncbi:hypothetical protein CWI39_0064p0030 [Hamiltosporidium magnivora]|uniref:Uncharacterized protein n=1 Tax=Hamiltosporidium magnivora TaxID=148818 RepID=A0A4Q9LN25_9MICR|nr:hypothetical protein CWI39_0064p0030 [Hamiltosporidium magnivora]
MKWILYVLLPNITSTGISSERKAYKRTCEQIKRQQQNNERSQNYIISYSKQGETVNFGPNNKRNKSRFYKKVKHDKNDNASTESEQEGNKKERKRNRKLRKKEDSKSKNDPLNKYLTSSRILKDDPTFDTIPKDEKMDGSGQSSHSCVTSEDYFADTSDFCD